MKKSEIKVGSVYIAKVSGKLVPVKILEEKTSQSTQWVMGQPKRRSTTWWLGLNTRTGFEVRIKSAAKLRKEVGMEPKGE